MIKTELESDIGAELRQRRIKAGYSLEELAAIANLSPTSLRSLELGRGSTLTTLIKVLHVLDEESIFLDWIKTGQEFSPIAYLNQIRGGPAKPHRVGRSRKKGDT